MPDDNYTFECLTIHIFPYSSQCTRFIVVYCAPSGSLVSLHMLIDYITHSIPLSPNAKYVILGDFYLPKLSGVITAVNAPISVDNVTQTFADFYHQFGLSQHILSPTRYDNFLDLIFTCTTFNFISNVRVYHKYKFKHLLNSCHYK
jgi:hypothetical protein